MKFTRGTYREAYRRLSKQSGVLQRALTYVGPGQIGWDSLSEMFIKTFRTEMAIRSRALREKGIKL
ncbi:hypothetical protein QEH42_gp065 [Microbacterium phage Pumpernickel]|uniref:Uncharacterized protein n=1 Tax=Microbacterium phage Pumpernickel TaxID=2885983 RepID=A0AAE9C2U8_9CAUD|nr:hypothetical protein QEH42_gp065 [Microbacterium phage Pumpernickel]UDL15856.1 hypothetical protein SEA_PUMPERNICKEL_65 [Microbacterium phage Pumpernickel]